MERFNDFMKRVCAECALPVDAAEETQGLYVLEIDEEYTLNIQYEPKSGNILVAVIVCELSDDTDAGTYRRLLEAGLFGKETGGGMFALDAEHRLLLYQYWLYLDRVLYDTTSFIAMLEKIMGLVAAWRSQLSSGENASLDTSPQADMDEKIGIDISANQRSLADLMSHYGQTDTIIA